MSRDLGQGGSSLFMFTITKQFDQRNDDQCQLAQITKGQLELHKRHPSLRVGLRDIFIFKKCSLTRYTEVYLRAEPSTVMAAPELRIAVRFYSTRNILFWQDLYSHRKKTATLPVFPHPFNSSKCKQQFIIFSNNITRIPVW